MMAQNLPPGQDENADLEARLYSLERAMVIERFHQAERAREWTIASVILQSGLLIGAALLLAERLGVIPGAFFDSGSPLIVTAAAVAVIILLANIASGVRALRRERSVPTVELHRPVEPAE